jgi:hypothetical protein
MPRAAGVGSGAYRLHEGRTLMMDKRITRLTRCNDEHGKIAHVWGVGPGKNDEWDYTGQYLLNLIALGSKEFYTEYQGQRACVLARKNKQGEFYLTTEPDSTQKNNLNEVEYVIIPC